MTLTVQWEPPQYDGGGPVNYTITVSPGLSSVTTSGTSVPVTVPYNVIHSVSIVATNCNGSSGAVIVTIPAIGEWEVPLLSLEIFFMTGIVLEAWSTFDPCCLLCSAYYFTVIGQPLLSACA